MYSFARTTKPSPFGAVANFDGKRKKSVPALRPFEDKRASAGSGIKVQAPIPSIIPSDLCRNIQAILLPYLHTQQGRQAVTEFAAGIKGILNLQEGHRSVMAGFAHWVNNIAPRLSDHLLTNSGSREEFKLALQQKRSAIQSAVNTALSPEVEPSMKDSQWKSSVLEKSDRAMDVILARLRAPVPFYQKQETPTALKRKKRASSDL